MLEAAVSSQALKPFFPFLFQGLDLGLLLSLGCCHCHCLGLLAWGSAPLALQHPLPFASVGA